MKKIFKVTQTYVAYVIASDLSDAETKFNNDEEFYSSESIKSETVDLEEVIDRLVYDLKN